MGKKLDEISWGIIGCGDVTELKSGPAFNKTEHSRLWAVMRRNSEKAEDYARRHGVPAWYDQADDLVNDPQVNAVYVATPPESHARYAVQAMKAGKPVYVEKPMARNYAECLEMIRVSEETGTPLLVAYYRRSLPGFLKVKELVEDGTIGKSLTVEVKLHKAYGVKDQHTDKQDWHVDPSISGGGHFFDLASHQFDYLDFLFGPVIEVRGLASNLAGYYTAEDTVAAAFSFESGVAGTGSWCFVSAPGQEEDLITISGTLGKITLPTFAPGPVRLFLPDGIHEMNFQNPVNISHNLIQQVVAELRGEGKCVSTGYSAARTSRVLDEITRAYYENKAGK